MQTKVQYIKEPSFGNVGRINAQAPARLYLDTLLSMAEWGEAIGYFEMNPGVVVSLEPSLR